MELSPFVVEAAEDRGSYEATATLAGTRIRTELKDVGSAIQVITSQFLQDTGARNSQDLLVYTTNTEVGGLSGNFVGAGNGAIVNTEAQRRTPQTNTRVRGLTSADNTRDFFLTDIPWDSYIVGRVDLQRGPNSILFGIGSPAGIVNSSLNSADFTDGGTLEARYGSYESYRASLDYNKVILEDQLAVRVAALNDKTNYRQDPAYNNDRRLYGALRFDPARLNQGSSHTSLTINYETGEINANRPRVIPPVDAITPWFTEMNQQTYDATTLGLNSPDDVAADPTNGAVFATLSTGAPNPNYQPWIDGGAGGQIFDQPIAVFPNPGTSEQTGLFEPTLQTQGLPAGVSYPWHVYRGIQPYNVWATKTNQPNQGLGVYKAFTVNDRSVFDSFDKLIDGPTKREGQDFEAFNAKLSQTFLDNKFGIEAAYDHQNYREEQVQTIPNAWLTVDVMNTLPDGSPNPNVGRAMVVGAPNSNHDRITEREAVRLTGFAELDFRDYLHDSPLGNILGRHSFTGLYMDQRTDLDTRDWYGYVANPNYRSQFSQSLDSRRVPSVHYLSDDLRGSNPQTVAINNLASVQTPHNGTLRAFNSALKPDATVPYGPDDIVGWVDFPLEVLDGFSGEDRNSLYSNASKVRDDIESQAIVWQGYFFNGNLVPIFGWRKDVAENFNAGDVPQNADTSRRVNDPSWTLPTGATDPRVGSNNVKYNREEGESKSWSIVVHTPESIRDRIPLRTGLSLFYNRSDNFQPAGGRTDVFGHSIASPTGKTKDYGFTISTLNDRLTFKVNWYETSVKNASLGGGGVGNLQNVYMVGYGEHWGRMFANWARMALPDFQGSTNYALNDPSDPTSGLIDPNIEYLAYQPDLANGQTVAEAKAAQDLAIDTLLANPPPADFASHWNIALNEDWSKGWGGYVSPIQPTSLAVTGDTFSKGVEYEIVAQPTPNWNILFNAAKTTARQTNLAESFASWVDERYEFYQGPAGDVRLWNGALGGETLRSKFTNEFYGSYLLYRLLEGSDVPELRPWRFNVITNYSFTEGALKGVNIGGGYRWQDQIVVGYPVVNGSFDIGHPYMGPAEKSIDLWAGYERSLTDKIRWRIQLNVRNAFGNDDFIPVTVQPDGTMATARIPEPTVWTLTNTFRF